MNKTITLGAGDSKEFKELGDFLRILGAAAPLDVTFYFQGREVSKAENVELGFAERFMQDAQGQRRFFDKVTIASATAQTVQFATRLGNTVSYDKAPVGNVAVVNSAGAFTHSRPNVGSGAVVQLLAANPLRRRLMVQNNTPAQYLRVTLDGSAPTAANGLRLIPGDLIDLADYAPTSAVNAIFEAGAAATVETVEG